MRIDIGLEIENSGVFIKPDNNILVITLNFSKFIENNKYKIPQGQDNIDVGDIATPLSSHMIYNSLESKDANIISKIETKDTIEYYFHCKIILDMVVGDFGKSVDKTTIEKFLHKKAFISPIFFSHPDNKTQEKKL